MNTHYAHVLATTGGDPDDQRPISLDGLLLVIGSKWEEDMTIDGDDYTAAPGQIVVRVEADEATLDAIAAAPGNVEIFRDVLPTEGVV